MDECEMFGHSLVAVILTDQDLEFTNCVRCGELFPTNATEQFLNKE